MGRNGAIRLAALLLVYDYYVVMKDNVDDNGAEIIYDALKNAFHGAALKNLEPKIEELFKTQLLSESEWHKILVSLYDMISSFTLEVFEFSKPNSSEDQERYRKFWAKQLG